MSTFRVVNPDVLENLAEKLSKKQLEKIGQDCYEGYRRDLNSRGDWAKKREDVAKLFSINRDGTVDVNFKGCSNIGLPIITMACIQFQSRALADLLPGKEVLKGVHVGTDPEMVATADRVERYMNYQLDYKMEEYRESMDVTFLRLPIDGTVVRKTYYDCVLGRNVSDWISADDFIINNSVRYLSRAERYSENIWMSPNDIKIRMENKVFIKYDGMEKGSQKAVDQNIKNQWIENQGSDSETYDETIAPRHIVEQHLILDLKDKGGIKQPYIVTFDYETQKVLRITSRLNPYDQNDVMEYYTPFHFLRSPDGFYGYGFGLLLKDANEAMNKIINDLIDSGSLQNKPMGLLLEGAGFEKGSMKFEFGEYKSVKLKVDDIRKALLPLNIAQPSTVLFSLLGTLQTYQDRLTTVTETQTGELAKSGTSATAVAAAVEQGQKVFNSIYRRIYASMGKEFQKLYVLNGIYLDVDEYFDIVIDKGAVTNISQEEIQQYGIQNPQQLQQFIEQRVLTVKEQIATDFQKGLRIQPVADISVMSRQEKAAKAEFVYNTILSNPITSQNPEAIVEALQNLLKAVDIDEHLINRVAKVPEPPQKPDLSQEEENFLFFKNQYTEPLEGQNHQQHLKNMADFRESVYFGQLTPESQAMFEQHQREHIGYLYLSEEADKAALEQQQGQAQPVNG